MDISKLYEFGIRVKSKNFSVRIETEDSKTSELFGNNIGA